MIHVRRWSRLASVVVILIGSLVLLGWGLNFPLLKSVAPGLATMKVNTAICCILVGAALWLTNGERPNRLTLILIAIVLVISLLTLLEYLSGLKLGIDELFIRDAALGPGSSTPGRMSQGTALALTLFVVALYLIRNPKRAPAAQILTLVAIGISVLALVGYLFGVASLQGIFAFSSVSLPSAAALLVTGLGILLVRSDQGFMAVITSSRHGGFVARSLIPAAIFIPLIVGLVCQKAQELGFISDQFEAAMFIVFNMVAFTVLIWWTAHLLNGIDIRRDRAEAMATRYAQRTDFLHKMDRDIISARSMQEVVEAAIGALRQLIACQRVSVALFDRDSVMATIIADDSHLPQSRHQGTQLAIPSDWLAEFGSAQIRKFDDLRLVENPLPIYKQLISDGLVSGIQTLLVENGHPVGLLGLNASTPGFFTAEHQEIAIEVAGQLTIAIQQRRLTDELEIQVRAVDDIRQFLQSTLDAFPANTAVLDPDGTIISVNLPWRRFADENDGTSHYLGTNNLTVCDTATGPMSEGAAEAAAGIRAVIAGEDNHFNLEYSCNSPIEERWFALRVTPFDEPVPRRVVISHINITERKLMEKAEREQRVVAEALRDSLAVLTASLNIETVMQQILAYSGTVIPSDAGTIILFEGDQARVAYTRGHSPETEAAFKNNPVINAAVYARKNEGYLVGDTTSTADWVSVPATAWIRSSLGVPIILRGETIGLLIADSSTPNRFQQKDRENLHAFAGYASLALGNAQHVDQLERKVKERTADLEAAKERVEAILDNSADGILLVNGNFTIQQTNAAFNNLFACYSDDCVHQPLTRLFQSEDSDRIIRSVQAGGAEQRILTIEVLARRKDDTNFEAELRIGFVTNGDFVCTVRDITERKAQERELRYHASLQQNVSDAVIVTDLDFVVQSWNKAAERIYGWSAAEVTGRAVAEMLLPESTEQELALSLQQLRERGWWQGEVVQHHKDGSERHILGAVTLVKDDLGIPFSIVSVNHDISERVRMQQALAVSEQRFTLMVNSILDYAIFMLDRDGNVATWNAGAEAIKGYTADEIIGQHFSRFYVPADVANGEPQRVLKLAEHEGRFIGEGWRVRKDGSTFWASMVVTAVRDTANQLVGFAKVTRDLTRRKQAEEALSDSETKFRLLLDAAPVATIISDQTGHITLVNVMAETLLGYNRADLIGQTVEMLVPETVREVHVQNRASYIATPRVRQMGGGAELFVRRKDGSQIPVEIQLSYIETQAGLLVMSFVVDVTERKERERQLRFHASLQENVTDAVISTDLDFKIQSWNPAAERIYGWQAHEVIGTDLGAALRTNFTADEERERTRRDFFVQGQWTAEVLQHRKDGTPIYVLSSVMLFKDENGKPFGVVAVNHDITERKNAELALRQALAKEKELNELKTRFVSMASHEFRTPLASILALTDTLSAYRQKMTDEQIESRFDKIRVQISHLKDIMDDVLQLARLQARRVDFNPTRINLDSLFRSVLDEFQSRPDITKTVLYRCKDPSCEAKVDKKLMRQIVSNLVSNAVKYSPEHTTITASLDCTDENLIFSVSDQGIGIPESDLSHLFEPFHRASNVGTISGTGLGLVITKESVELHKGSIAVESQVGVGTTFVVSIPLMTKEEVIHDENPGG